ncbi:MAG: hypothetical protein ABI901_14565, partial [Roseiflexaceae bacterium]
RNQLIAMQLNPGGDTLDEANDVLGSDLHHYPPEFRIQEPEFRRTVKSMIPAYSMNSVSF